MLGAKNIISEFFFQNSKWRPIWPPKSINLRNFDAIQSILTEVFYGDLNRIKKKHFEIHLNNPDFTSAGSYEAK